MSTKKRQPPLALDLSFEEALERFANVDIAEVKTDKRAEKKSKKLKKKT